MKVKLEFNQWKGVTTCDWTINFGFIKVVISQIDVYKTYLLSCCKTAAITAKQMQFLGGSG